MEEVLANLVDIDDVGECSASDASCEKADARNDGNAPERKRANTDDSNKVRSVAPSGFPIAPRSQESVVKASASLCLVAPNVCQLLAHCV